MTDSTDDVDMGYSGEDAHEAKVKNNIKNIDKFIKSTGKNQKGKKFQDLVPETPPVDNSHIKDIHYSFKVSLPLSDEKFAAWYTIEYGETRAVKQTVNLDKQKEEMMNAIEDEVVNSVALLRQNIKDGKVWKTIM